MIGVRRVKCRQRQLERRKQLGGRSLQLYVVADCSVADAISAVDTFFAKHANRLRELHFHESQRDELSPMSEVLSPQLMLEITFAHSLHADVTIPTRLLRNLEQTGIPIKFDVRR